MALTAGTRLGPYEISGLIGAGGMGEVYKARDTRLDRTVAIKVLPSDFSSDPDRRARFEREAKTIATLSHPNICTLHDVGQHAGSTFLVMEHLAGDTLHDRLLKGPMPIEQALEVAAQVAEGLAAAHRVGIVHRDLKPGNVMLTKSGVKLLDFGLAKLRAPAGQAEIASSVTRTQPLSGEGTILGTLPYMAPEQIEGKDADGRTDIWALGLVIYEMLTGKRAFDASSDASLIAAILERQPPLPSAVQPLSPPALDRLVARSICKDPDGRWQDAGDLADELRWVAATLALPTGAIGRGRANTSRLRTGSWLMALFSLLVTGAGGWWLWHAPSGGSRAVRRLVVETAAGIEPLGAVAVSPDGERIAFVATDAMQRRVFVRRLDEWDAHAVPGTEKATFVCFSPDGQWLGFWGPPQGQLPLRRVPVGGGVPGCRPCRSRRQMGARWPDSVHP